MKASNDSRRKQSGGLASSFSLTEKSAPRERDRDEHNSTGILTWGLASLPPSRRAKFSRGSGAWEFVARYSGATVPDSHRVP